MTLFSYFFLLIFLPFGILLKWGGSKVVSDQTPILLLISIVFWIWFFRSFSFFPLFAVLFLIFLNYPLMKTYIQNKKRVWGGIATLLNITFIGAILFGFKRTGYYQHLFDQHLSLFFLFPVLFLSFFLNVFSLWIDIVYQRVDQNELKLSSFLLYLLYFPALLSLTFLPYKSFVHSCKYREDRYSHSRGLFLLAIGLFKIVFLVAPFHSFIYKGFESTGVWVNNLESLFSVLCVIFFFYFLFSGISDLARGVSLMLGMPLPHNFDRSLRTKGVSDFFSHTFITVKQFVDEYLYFVISNWTTRYRLLWLHLTLVGSALLLFNLSILKLLAGIYVLWLTEFFWKKRGIKLPIIVAKLVFYFSMSVVIVLWLSPTFIYAKSMLAGLVGLHGFALPDTLLKLSIFKFLAPYVYFCDNNGELSFLGATSTLYFWIFLGFFVGHLGESSARMSKDFRSNMTTLLFTVLLLILSLIYLYDIPFFDVIGVSYV